MKLHIKLDGNKKWFSVDIKLNKITKGELFLNYLDYIDLEDWFMVVDGEKMPHNDVYECESLLISDWDHGGISE